jgi:ornithine cyclodeaminase/alanine dehydrogenase
MLALDPGSYRAFERDGKCLYLSRRDVEGLELSMEDIIDVVEAALGEKGGGRVEMPPKPGIHTRDDAFIHAMPAYLPKMRGAGMKWVSGYPTNSERGLPYITGLLILNAPDTGVPICVMDCTWITAVRTAAASAVAAKFLGPKGGATVAMVGCGVQGRTNLQALSVVMKIESVVAYDIVSAAAVRYATEMSTSVGVPIRTACSVREAVSGADVIVTSTPIQKKSRQEIREEWLKPNCLGIPLDFDSCWGNALLGADRFFVDDVAQFEYYKTQGFFQLTPQVSGDLGQLVIGSVAGRTDPAERIICVNLGLGLEDIATAVLVFSKAVSARVGTVLAL